MKKKKSFLDLEATPENDEWWKHFCDPYNNKKPKGYDKMLKKMMKIIRRSN